MAREKLRDHIHFNCPRCKGWNRIEVRRQEKIFETCFRPDVPLGDAEKVIMINHYLAAHTDHGPCGTVDEELKRRFTEKAVELLKQDGLLNSGWRIQNLEDRLLVYVT